ncbi:MAG: hypothetical protein QOE70_3798 [Chthoniobacter sp.]|nr:hypothetical protein [Chthoniobacter sp.]
MAGVQQFAEVRQVQFGGLGAGVKVKFAQAGRQAGENSGESLARHPARIAQAIDAIGGADRPPLQRPGRRVAERAKDERDRGKISRLADEADELEPAAGERSER